MSDGKSCCAACAESGGSCGTGTVGGARSPVYRVQAGDTPMRIASQMTGNGMRYVELVGANKQKKRSGTTFASLKEGEYLRLPPTWGSKRVQGLGATQADTDALTALVAAIAGDGTVCQASKGNGNANVAAFQQAWDASSYVTADGNATLASADGTYDGLYGHGTAGAAAIVSGSSAPAACAQFTGSAGGASAALLAAAKALDTILAQPSTYQCVTGDTTSTLAGAVYNFKTASLATPGCTSTACDTTVAGASTLNMSGTAGYAYGPGSDTLLTAVLGSSRTYTGGPLTDSNGTCLGTAAPAPAPGPTQPGGAPIVTTTTTTTSASNSSSATPYVIGLLLIAAGGGAVWWMKKHPSKMSATHHTAARA
jgi:hypothetical protein